MLMLVLAGGGCSFRQQFGVVRPGVLYRGSQPKPADLAEIKAKYGIKTVVCMRTYDYGPFQGYLDELAGAEQRYVRQAGMQLVEMPLPSGTPSEAWMVRRLFELVEDPARRPVFLHCYAGFERTAAMVAAFRIRYDGRSTDRCVDEMYRYGYSDLFWPRQKEFVRRLPKFLAWAGLDRTDSPLAVARVRRQNLSLPAATPYPPHYGRPGWSVWTHPQPAWP